MTAEDEREQEDDANRNFAATTPEVCFRKGMMHFISD
jgi:hypothetical protein